MSTPNTRWILCDHCDAIHRLALQARSLHCGHCGLEQPVPRRDDSPLAHPHSPMHQMSAATYFAMLRTQDGPPAPLPPHLAPLLEVGELADARVTEAQAQFRNVRLALRRAPNARAREDVYWLALLLSRHHFSADQLRQQRAVLETALDLAAQSRHRQVLRCMLGMARAAAGDLEGAEAWIAPCDPMSGDLQADSALRILAAFVATARSDRALVLHHLGDRHDAIPIDDAREAEAAVLRANALEKSGRHEASIRTLMDTIDFFGPFCHRQMESFAALHPRLMLCTHSFPAVAQRRRDARAGLIRPHILLVAGLLLASLPLAMASFGPFLLWLVPEREALPIGAAVTIPCLLMAALIARHFGRLWNVARRNLRTVRNGVPATGQVAHIGPALQGMPAEEGLVAVRVTFQVRRRGHAPHFASCVTGLRADTIEQLRRGGPVPVLFDPDAPQHALFEVRP